MLKIEKDEKGIGKGFGLSSRFAAADESYFHFLVAVRAGDVDSDELAEYPLRHRRYHRIDVVKTLVEQIEASFQAL